MDTNCQELHELSFAIERGLLSPLEGISEEHLNYSPAEHKMTIGQLAVHCMGWAQYFLAEEKWTPMKWTCVPVTYPLKLDSVLEVVDRGFYRIREVLEQIDDQLLERTASGERGPGYIIYRLLIHAMTHANQMAYLRQTVEPSWSFGSSFGDMATAVIKTRYHTYLDPEVPGF